MRLDKQIIKIAKDGRERVLADYTNRLDLPKDEMLMALSSMVRRGWLERRVLEDNGGRKVATWIASGGIETVPLRTPREAAQ